MTADAADEAGVIASETRAPVEPPDVTVSKALPIRVPPKPLVVAEIVVVPVVRAVASPVALTVAMLGALDAHFAVLVRSTVFVGWPAWVSIPLAVNCTLLPPAID